MSNSSFFNSILLLFPLNADSKSVKYLIPYQSKRLYQSGDQNVVCINSSPFIDDLVLVQTGTIKSTSLYIYLGFLIRSVQWTGIETPQTFLHIAFRIRFAHFVVMSKHVSGICWYSASRCLRHSLTCFTFPPHAMHCTDGPSAWCWQSP